MTDEALEVNSWDEMVDWLVEQLTDKPVGLVIDIGPKDFRVPSHLDSLFMEHTEIEDEVFCVQFHLLEDDVVMVRRSKVMMRTLRLLDHQVADVCLDRWYFDDGFEDCTDGALYTQDLKVAAEACVSWFRDNENAPKLGDMGMAYEFADELPEHGMKPLASDFDADAFAADHMPSYLPLLMMYAGTMEAHRLNDEAGIDLGHRYLLAYQVYMGIDFAKLQFRHGEYAGDEYESWSVLFGRAVEAIVACQSIFREPIPGPTLEDVSAEYEPRIEEALDGQRDVYLRLLNEIAERVFGPCPPHPTRKQLKKMGLVES